MNKTKIIALVFGGLIVCGYSNAWAVERYLRLPFGDNIKLQQGWIYDTGNLHKGLDYINGTVDRSSDWKAFDVTAGSSGQALYNWSST